MKLVHTRESTLGNLNKLRPVCRVLVVYKYWYPDKMEHDEKCWGYSCRPYQDSHVRIRKQGTILSGCGRHTDRIWQDQGMK